MQTGPWTTLLSSVPPEQKSPKSALLAILRAAALDPDLRKTDRALPPIAKGDVSTHRGFADFIAALEAEDDVLRIQRAGGEGISWICPQIALSLMELTVVPDRMLKAAMEALEEDHGLVRDLTFHGYASRRKLDWKAALESWIVGLHIDIAGLGNASRRTEGFCTDVASGRPYADPSAALAGIDAAAQDWGLISAPLYAPPLLRMLGHAEGRSLQGFQDSALTAQSGIALALAAALLCEPAEEAICAPEAAYEEAAVRLLAQAMTATALAANPVTDPAVGPVPIGEFPGALSAAPDAESLAAPQVLLALSRAFRACRKEDLHWSIEDMLLKFEGLVFGGPHVLPGELLARAANIFAESIACPEPVARTVLASLLYWARMDAETPTGPGGNRDDADALASALTAALRIVSPEAKPVSIRDLPKAQGAAGPGARRRA